MIKRFLIVFVVISMVLCVSVIAMPPVWSCNDVKEGMWFYDIMHSLNSSRIIVGDGSNNLYPDRLITRGELVALFARIDSEYLDNYGKYGKPSFDDVKETQYYSQAISWAENKGIVSGVSQNSFAPEEIVTREQLFVMTANYIQKIGYPLESKKNIQFIDFDETSHWAKESVLLCAQAGLASGLPNGTLQPKGNVTRAQAASVIYRIYGWMNHWFE